MPIIKNDELETFQLPGLLHQTIAGYTGCTEYGSLVGGETFDFASNSTLIIPPDVVHQIVNTSS